MKHIPYRALLLVWLLLFILYLPAFAQDTSSTATPTETLTAEDYFEQGLAHYEEGEFDLAIRDFDRAIDLDPELAEAYNYRGLAYGDVSEYEQAIIDFDLTVELRPLYVDAYINRSISYMQLGDYDTGAIDSIHAIELSPNDPIPHALLGISLDARGESEDALASYRRHVELAGDQALPFFVERKEALESELGED